MKKIITSLCISIGFLGIANAGENVGTAKTTATIQATCSINANPIGFGIVFSPLMMQQSQSEMSIKCSNAAAYTVDLAYGGIYGQGSSNNAYILSYYGDVNPTYNYYNISNSSGVIGAMGCGYAGVTEGKVNFQNVAVANLYGYINKGMWLPDTKGACTSNSTKSGTYPRGWIGAYNDTNSQPMGGSGYSYGLMIGASKGDNVAYSIAVPGEPNKVWNSGNNSYKSTGNGESQTIPLAAKIMPENSGNQYPAPDMYLDTVTAIISY